MKEKSLNRREKGLVELFLIDLLQSEIDMFYEFLSHEISLGEDSCRLLWQTNQLLENR